MKIVDRKQNNLINRQAFWPLLAGLALVAGILLGNAGAVNNLGETLENIWRDSAVLSSSTTLPLWTIDLDFEAYNQLLGKREEALQQGILFPDEGDFAPADLRLNNAQIPAQIRLLPGPARHLEANDKWNYELRARDDARLAEQGQVNLLDPADNGWLNEWAFLQAARLEGLPAADYEFIRLTLNGDDRGTYALQENIGPVAYDDTGQPAGVIVSYETEPLLETIASYGDLETAAADPLSNIAGQDPRFLQVAEINDPLVRDDPQLVAQAERAVSLLQGLQSGELVASEVFDAEQYGRFLALVDLWGANAALSPLNLHYRYNSDLDRLQPIALNGNPLSGNERLPLAVMYQDPQIQAAYAAAAARFSEPAYLESLRTTLEVPYQALAQSISASRQDANIWAELAQRQEQMRLSLQPNQPVIAQLGSPSLTQQAIIRVNVANALNVPLEVLGFDIDGATFMDVESGWISSGQNFLQPHEDRILLLPVDDGGGALGFVAFDLPLTEIIEQDDELTFLNEVEIRVATRVLGLEDTQLTPAGPGLFENR